MARQCDEARHGSEKDVIRDLQRWSELYFVVRAYSPAKSPFQAHLAEPAPLVRGKFEALVVSEAGDERVIEYDSACPAGFQKPPCLPNAPAFPRGGGTACPGNRRATAAHEGWLSFRTLFGSDVEDGARFLAGLRSLPSGPGLTPSKIPGLEVRPDKGITAAPDNFTPSIDVTVRLRADPASSLQDLFGLPWYFGLFDNLNFPRFLREEVTPLWR